MVTRQRALDIPDHREKKNRQGLQWHQSYHEQGRNSISRPISILDDYQPSKKRQRVARTPSHANFSGELASFPPTYGGSRRIYKLSWTPDLDSLQSEGPIPVPSNSRAEIFVPSVDIMDRMMEAEAMMEVQMHELQWLKMRQKR